jgi:hypothetical protein
MAKGDARNPRQNEALGLGAAEPFEPIEPIEVAEIVPGAASAIEWLNDPAAATQRALKSDPDEARQFLLATDRKVHHLMWIPAMGGPTEGMTVDVIDPTAWASTVSALREKNDARHGIYWHPNPVKPGATPGGGKFSDADIAAVTHFVADFDPAVAKGGERASYDAARAALRASVASFVEGGAMPTLAVDGGNGIQLFYRLAEPMTPEAGREAMASFQCALGADNTADPSRVMRVPGFVNWSSKSKLAKGYPERTPACRLPGDLTTARQADEIMALLPPEPLLERKKAVKAAAAPAPAPAYPVGPAGPVPVLPAHLTGWIALAAQADAEGDFLINAATDADNAKLRRRATVRSGDDDGAKLDEAMAWHAERVSLGGHYASAVEGEAFTGDRSACLLAQTKACAEAGRTFLQFVHIVVAGGGAGRDHAMDQGVERKRARALRRAWETTEGEDWGITDHSGVTLDWAPGLEASLTAAATAGDDAPVEDAGLAEDAPAAAPLTPEQEVALRDLPALLATTDPLRPPGVLGELADWGWSMGFMDNRETALAGAVNGVGGLVGIHVYIRIGKKKYTSMSTSIMPLAESGGGKQSAVDTAVAVLDAFGLADRFVRPASEAGMHAAMLKLKGCMVMHLDEGGAFMAALKGENGAGHKKDIMELAKIVWSGGATALSGASRSKSSDNKAPMEQPTLALLRASTLEAMAPALTGRQTADGMLNRMLLIHAEGEREEMGDEDDDYAVIDMGEDDGEDEEGGGLPDRLIRKLSHLSPTALDSKAAGPGRALPAEVQPPRFAVGRVRSKPTMTVMISPDARRLHAALGRYAKARGKRALPVTKPIWVRPKEIALRLAGLAAAADNKPEIDLPSMRWAAALTLQSVEAFVVLATEHIADTLEAAAEQRIMAFMWKGTNKGVLRGDGNIDRRTILNACKGGQITYRRVGQAIADLVDAGLITPVRGEVGGPKRVTLTPLGRRGKP